MSHELPERTNAVAEAAAALLAGARDGRQEAWAALVDRYSPLLWAVARSFRLSEQDTADTLQMTWLRLVENLDRIQQPSALPSWLITTCRREALRTTRISARCMPYDMSSSEQGLEVGVDPAVEPVEGALRNEIRTAVRAALKELPARQQQLLTTILHLQGTTRSYEEIASVLDMPIGSIGPTRQRALRRLRADQSLAALSQPE